MPGGVGATTEPAGPAGDRTAAPNPFFAEHAHAYATSAAHAAGWDLARLVALVTAHGGRRAVDVGTGTGHTALALARRGVHAIGVDPTPAMLSEAEALAASAGLGHLVQWVRGTAESLPLPSASADIVTCRRAAHHFRDIGQALVEMARVLRPGGVAGISDLCPEAALGPVADRFERLRDPTHVRMLSETDWREGLEAAGLQVRHLEVRDETVPFAEWLRPLAAEGPQALALQAALAGLDGQVRSGLTGGREQGWRKRRALVLAMR